MHFHKVASFYLMKLYLLDVRAFILYLQTVSYFNVMLSEAIVLANDPVMRIISLFLMKDFHLSSMQM